VELAKDDDEMHLKNKHELLRETRETREMGEKGTRTIARSYNDLTPARLLSSPRCRWPLYIFVVDTTCPPSHLSVVRASLLAALEGLPSSAYVAIALFAHRIALIDIQSVGTTMHARYTTLQRDDTVSMRRDSDIDRDMDMNNVNTEEEEDEEEYKNTGSLSSSSSSSSGEGDGEGDEYVHLCTAITSAVPLHRVCGRRERVIVRLHEAKHKVAKAIQAIQSSRRSRGGRRGGGGGGGGGRRTTMSEKTSASENNESNEEDDEYDDSYDQFVPSSASDGVSVVVNVPPPQPLLPARPRPVRRRVQQAFGACAASLIEWISNPDLSDDSATRSPCPPHSHFAPRLMCFLYERCNLGPGALPDKSQSEKETDEATKQSNKEQQAKHVSA
jgi:hypothetical protein